MSSVPVVFDFKEYKAYLNARLDHESLGRGSRSRLSEAMNCQTAYTAQVLRGSAELSLEQGEAANQFLGHGEEEGEFFLLLLQVHRAGTPALRSRLERQLDRIRERRAKLSTRLGVDQKLTLSDQTVYYGEWFYAATHAASSIPGVHSAKQVAQRLGLEIEAAQKALEFLLEKGIIEADTEKRRFRPAQLRMHLPSDSPLISRLHSHWRLQALRSLERSQKEDLHYSSVVSVSNEDAPRIRELLTRAIEQAKAIIRESPEERVQVLSVDCFRLDRDPNR